MYIRKVSYWARLEKTGESTGDITERWGKMGKAREGWKILKKYCRKGWKTFEKVEVG